MSVEERDPTVAATESFLHARRDELVQFAAQLVATPSPSPPGDESAVAHLVATQLHEFGAKVSVVEAGVGRHNVIATFAGDRSSPVLILNGHLDTKPPGDLSAWETPPFEPVIRDGTLHGLGAADMKGAVAAITFAAGAVGAAGVQGTLRVVFTADEEAGGHFGSKWLAKRNLLEGDACVIAEPAGIHQEWEAIRLVSRGVAIFRISVSGTQMHSSLSDELASVNANLAMARLMIKMSEAAGTMLRYQRHDLSEWGPTFNVGLVAEGGIGYGVFPGHAEFLCDVRTLPGMTAAEIEEDVRAFISAAEADEPNLHTDFEFLSWTPSAEIERGHPIVRALQAASQEVLGATPPLAIFPGGTDAPFFSGLAGIPTVPAFGPGLLTSAHMPNEAISTKSIIEAARIYALAAVHYLR